MLWETDESRYLPFKNPDGFLYLQYLRLSTILFSICNIYLFFIPHFSICVFNSDPPALLHPPEGNLILILATLVRLSFLLFIRLPYYCWRINQPTACIPSTGPHILIQRLILLCHNRANGSKPDARGGIRSIDKFQGWIRGGTYGNHKGHQYGVASRGG